MALINCPECSRQVSSEAPACPGCGYPVAQRPVARPAPSEPAAAALNPGELLREVRPSWWNFFWHLVFFWLLVPLLVALYRRNTYLMKIYSDRVSIEEGFWSKETSEFFIRDIRSVDLRQSFWKRVLGIGDLTISTAATVDAAETAVGVANPDKIKDLLIELRQSANAGRTGASSE